MPLKTKSDTARTSYSICGGYMGGRLSLLPGEIWPIYHGDAFRSGNPHSNVRLNGQKSAEAIVGRVGTGCEDMVPGTQVIKLLLVNSNHHGIVFSEVMPGGEKTTCRAMVPGTHEGNGARHPSYQVIAVNAVRSKTLGSDLRARTRAESRYVFRSSSLNSATVRVGYARIRVCAKSIGKWCQAPSYQVIELTHRKGERFGIFR